MCIYVVGQVLPSSRRLNNLNDLTLEVFFSLLCLVLSDHKNTVA